MNIHIVLDNNYKITEVNLREKKTNFSRFYSLDFLHGNQVLSSVIDVQIWD